MTTFQNFGLQQPPHPLPNGGGSSNGLEDREALTRTGKACAFPFEPPKLEAQTEKPQTCAVAAAFDAELRRASKPGALFLRDERIIPLTSSSKPKSKEQNEIAMRKNYSVNNQPGDAF